MNNIPDTIRIAGFDVDIEMQELAAAMSEYGAMGEANTFIQKITLAKYIHQDQSQVTLLHEILHLIANYYNIKLPKDNAEFIVDGFARGLFQVFKDNPELAQALFKLPIK